MRVTAAAGGGGGGAERLPGAERSSPGPGECSPCWDSPTRPSRTAPCPSPGAPVCPACTP